MLSLNPENGELAYRPVVRRTVRPRTVITDLQVNGERIGATLAHSLWVTGRGWVGASEGLECRRLAARVWAFHSISSTAEAQVDLSFNLELADFHTFFVGESKILVHDSATIDDTRHKVPGLKLGSGELPVE